jgi:2-iminobutanoate/2-iminopropanoate deaminase
MSRQIISSSKAPAPIGPYQQGISAGGFLFTSGQIGIDPSTGRLVQGGVEAQAERVFRSLLAILQEAGSSAEQVIKVNIYLKDLNDFSTVNRIYERFFGANPPARTTVQVSGLPMGAALEADLVAKVE